MKGRHAALLVAVCGVLAAWLALQVAPRRGEDPERLAALLSDLRDRHRDAEHLGVCVFDSVEAARRPSWIDQGRSHERHLVAELRRDVASGRWLRVRGRDSEP